MESGNWRNWEELCIRNLQNGEIGGHHTYMKSRWLRSRRREWHRRSRWREYLAQLFADRACEGGKRWRRDSDEGVDLVRRRDAGKLAGRGIGLGIGELNWGARLGCSWIEREIANLIRLLGTGYIPIDLKNRYGLKCIPVILKHRSASPLLTTPLI